MRVRTVRQSPLSMAKRSRANGFTLSETLVVLLVVFVLAHMVLLPGRNSDMLYVHTLKEACVEAQMKAFSQKRTVDVRFNVNEAHIDGVVYDYPHDMVCTPLSFSYTPNGMITKGGSLTCTNEKETKRIVFQIGMGRVRIE